MKRRTIRCFVITFAIALIGGTLICATNARAGRNSAQTSAQSSAASPGQFETLPDWSDPEFAKFVYSVVSIKPFKENDTGVMSSLGTQWTPDGYIAAFPVHGLIYEAYKTDHYKVVGGSGWIISEM